MNARKLAEIFASVLILILVVSPARADYILTLGMNGITTIGTATITLASTPKTGSEHFAQAGTLADMIFSIDNETFNLGDSVGGAYADTTNGLPTDINYVGFLNDGAALAISYLAYTYVSASGNVDTGSIPEPSAVAILGIAGIALMALYRRRPARRPA